VASTEVAVPLALAQVAGPVAPALAAAEALDRVKDLDLGSVEAVTPVDLEAGSMAEG